jgi:6-phosphogluconolactonase
LTATERVIVPSKAELPTASAPRIAALIRSAVEERGICHVALAGGNTPRAVHAELATIPDIPWGAVRFYFGDERCVPPDHAESNYRMARESLFEPLGIPADHVLRMEAESENKEAAAAKYADALPPRLDLVMLGMGPDGHTASLFPGYPAVTDTRSCVVVGNSPKPPSFRLSLTPRTIRAARAVFVLVYGADKAPKVREALEGELDLDTVPVQVARGGTWFLDQASAAQLR